ncbi:MAG: transposase [PVC group bacterium]
MDLYTGIDLHSNNGFCGILNMEGGRVFQKKMPNDLSRVLATLYPFKLETGSISRYAGAGNYASYCRAVKADHTSNEKKKRKGNQKNGNKYLVWASIEAANFIRRYCPEAKRYHQKKMARTNRVVVTKALASKVAKACFYIMRDQVDLDVKKMFG